MLLDVINKTRWQNNILEKSTQHCDIGNILESPCKKIWYLSFDQFRVLIVAYVHCILVCFEVAEVCYFFFFFFDLGILLSSCLSYITDFHIQIKHTV